MRSILLFVACATFLASCGEPTQPAVETPAPPFVKVKALTPAAEAELGLSGTVRARIESPMAFQVGGRIASRLVDAGQTVRAGQLLFWLDARDLEQAVRAAVSDVAAADAALASAEADLARSRQLHQQSFISAQALERAELARREAQTRRDAAATRLVQARNALGYAQLQSPAPGVLVGVTGEPGQVVATGQPVAVLAHAGAREIEVHFPDHVAPPVEGEAILGNGDSVALKLREMAGAVDAQGRTLRARYTVLQWADELVLGTVVRARFVGKASMAAVYAVPIGAIDERGQGPRVWRVKEGKVEPVAVALLAVDDASARIQGPLAADDRIVALGTHLLTDGMSVQVLAQ